METQHLALAISAANFALTWGVALYMYLANKNKVTNERINTLQEDIDDKLDDHSERIAKLEVTTERAPNHAHLGSLHEKVNAVDLKVSGIAGRLEGIDASLRQVLSRIMEKGLK
ncbi:MAG: hypothetical protein Q8O34_00755 [Rhodocyclaceae bacterium]|nr:hypothetical protein [Rhodocyclaceae bacterium]